MLCSAQWWEESPNLRALLLAVHPSKLRKGREVCPEVAESIRALVVLRFQTSQGSTPVLEACPYRAYAVTVAEARMQFISASIASVW